MENGITSNNKRPEEFCGYIVTLNTLARLFPDTREDLIRYCQTVSEKARKRDKGFEHHTQTYLTYGDFDRISFRGMDRFSRFFDLDDRSKYWLGKHQNVFLYTIDDDSATRLYPYQFESSEDSDPTDSDFGFCIQDKKDKWFLYSALKQTDPIRQNPEIDKDELKQYCFPFFAITLISFSNDVITRIINFKEFIKVVKKELNDRIDKIIELGGAKLKYEIFGSLNTSELCVIWLAEQYTDIFDVIEQLKTITFDIRAEDGTSYNLENKRLFFVFYSIVGRTLANKLVANQDLQNKISENKKASARIEIITGNEDSARSLWEKIEKEADKLKLEGLKKTIGSAQSGEHDLSFSVPVSALYNLFCETSKNQENGEKPNGNEIVQTGLFKVEEIKNRIIGIQATLLSDIEDEKKKEIETRETGAAEEHPENEKDGNNEPVYFSYKYVSGVNDTDKLVDQFARLSEELNPDYKDDDYVIALYTRIREKMKDTFNSHSGSVDTLDTLYRDYLSNIHESYNALWRNDYNYQFKRSLNYLEYILEDIVSKEKVKEDDDKRFWEQFTNTIENIRQQTVHFSQSGRLGVQVPSSNLRYTAGADMMLHSYYGSVKAVLEDAYHRQEEIENLRQSELLPIITTNSTPYITSTLYKAGNECDDLRILQVDIPYSLLFDPLVGFSYLVHEMFHYISPNNRDERNDAICSMIINEVICIRYLRQIEKGFKRHFYELMCSFPDKYRELCREYLQDIQGLDNTPERIPDSEENVVFSMLFEKCISSFDTNRTPDILYTLHTSLSDFLWKNDVVKEIRRKLLGEIKKDSADFHASNATWNDAIKSMWNHLKEMPIDVTSSISEQIRWSIAQVEKEVKSQNNQELRIITKNKGCPRCREYTESRVNLKSLEEGLEKRAFPELFEKILFDHKYTLLNPYHLEIISESCPSALNVNDRFINGLRESTPDIAMVSYCDMNDIDYLVTYARQIHDTGNDLIAEFDKVRLYSVLTWMNNESNEESAKKPILKFEEKGAEFIKKYLAEYMPQSWDKQKQEEDLNEKLAIIIKTAICWFLRIRASLYSYRRNYIIYKEEIRRLGNCYTIYYQTDSGNERTRLLKRLTDIVRKRREKKQEIRFGGPEKEKWDCLIERTTGILQSILWDEDGFAKIPYIPDKKEEEEIHGQVLDILKEIRLDVNRYEENNKQYNKQNFESILNFIYTSEIQTTFEKISSKVGNKRKKGLSNGEFGNIEKPLFNGVTSLTNAGEKDICGAISLDYSRRRDNIYQTVEGRTSYRIWGMSDLAGRLSLIRNRMMPEKEEELSPIWYCTRNAYELLKPNVFNKTNSSQEYKAIYELVEGALQLYLHEHEGDLRDYFEHESVARMTLESPSRDTNLLFWQGSLHASLPESDEDNIQEYTSLYLFSPVKYLSIRKRVLEYYKSKKKGRYDLSELKTTPIIFQHGVRRDEYYRYILGNSTSQKVKDATLGMKGEIDQDNHEGVVDFSPIPLSFVGLKQNCRFLAYDLASPIVNNPEKDFFSLNDIQKKMIFNLDFIKEMKIKEEELLGKNNIPREEINTLIDENAFLYRLDMGKEVLQQLKDLTTR